MKIKNNIRNKIFYCTVLLFLINLIVGYSSVYAASNPELENKALATSVANCTAKFEENIKVQDFISAPSYENASRFVKKDGEGGGINGTLPNGFTHGNCAEFLDVVMNKGGKTARTSDAKVAGEFLEGIGYMNNNGGSSGECVYFNYYTNRNDKPKEKTYSPTRALCAAVVNSDGTIGVDKLEVVGDVLMVNGGNDDAVQFEVKKGSVTLDCSTSDFLSKGTCGTHTFKNGETNWRVFAEEIQNDLLENNQYNVRAFLGYTYSLDSENPTEYRTYGDTTAVYSPESSSVLKEKSMSYFVGKNYADDKLKFSKEEKFVIYQNYLKEFFGADVQCDWNETQITANTANGYKPINFYDGNTIRNCYAKAMKNTSEKVNGIDGDGNFTVNTCDYDCVVTWLGENKVNVADLKNYDIRTSVGILRSAEEVADESCRDVSGAKGLGWILCPVLEWMGGAATGLYDGVVGPLLSIDPKLFNNGETNNTTEEAWETFRNIANVIFIILFLVVIFSQLTGVGIDNYGIKKILPRLIVAAVMINLSYILCILLVDISNILGSGLRGIFEVLGNDINPTISLDGVVFADGNTATTVAGSIAGISLFGLVAGGIGVAIFGGAATILSLVVSGIGVMISIIFMFLLLSVREAAIVVLVVLSPLVVVAYMLPNTKKLFDKWWKLFEGLLLVYPIAGMLVGAGNYASKLLLALNPNDFFSWITAMVVGIVPIFFIPTVLKGAFSAMGKVGGMLTGLGSTVSKKATTAANNTGIAKNIRKSSEDRQLRWKAGMDRNGNTSAFRKGVGTVLSLGGTNRQRNALAYQKAISERGSLKAADSENFMLDTLAANEVKRIKAGDDASNIGALQGHLQDALKSGDRAKIMAYTDVLTGQGQYGRDAVKNAYNNSVDTMSDVAAKTFARNIMLNHASDYKSNSRSMFEIARGINNGSAEFGSSANGGFKKTSDYVAMTENDRGRKHLMMKSDAGTMADMDNSSFAETFLRGDPEEALKAYKNGKVEEVNLGNLEPEEKEAIGKNAFNALRNASNMDANRVAFLRAILSQSGYEEGLAGPGSSVGGSTGGAGGSGTGAEGAGGDNSNNNASVSGVGDVYTSGSHTFTRQANGRWTDENGNMMGGDFSARINSNPAAQQQIRENARKSSMYTNMSDEKIVQLANSTPANSDQQLASQGYAEYDNISGRSSMMLKEMPDGTLQDNSGNAYNPDRWKRNAASAQNNNTGMNSSKKIGPSEAVIRSAQREASRRGLEFGSSGQNKQMDKN